MGRQQIESHTALRGVAALAVVAYHLQFGGGYHLAIETATPIWRRSYLFVDLFFILSGFIISYANRADGGRTVTRGDYWAFLKGRFARIYPLHLFCLVAMAALWFVNDGARMLLDRQRLGAPGTPADFAIQLVLLNSWIGERESWNIPSWSISAEMVAYLLFPLAVSLGARSRGVLTLLLAGVAFAFFSGIAVTTGSLDIVVGLAPLRCLAGFALGMLIFFARDRIAQASDLALTVVQLASIAGIVAALAGDSNDVAIVPAFAALVASTWNDRGLLPRLLVNRTTRFLGEVSYSIYLVHAVFLSVYNWRRLDPIAAIDPPLMRALYLATAFALLIGVSTLTYRYVEKPARRWLGRKLLGHAPPPIATAAPAP